MGSNNKKITGAMADGIVAILLMGLWIVSMSGFNDNMRFKCLLLLVVSVGYLIVWLKRTKSIKSLFLFFLIYSIMTNAGQLFLSVFSVDIVYSFNVFDITDDSVMSKTIDYQAMCTIMMCTGALIAHRFYAISPETKKMSFEKQMNERRETGWSIQDLMYVILGFVYLFMNLLRLDSRVDNVYLDAFNSGESYSVPFIIQFAFYILMYYACYKHRINGDPFKKVIVFINILVGVSNILYGSRNVIIPLIFGMLFLWNFDFKSLSFKRKIGLFVLALISLYLLGAFVNIRRVSLSRLSFSFILDALFGVNLYDQVVMLVSEMGGSLRVLTTTIEEIDQGIVQSEPTILYTVLKGIVPKMDLLEFVGITEPERWRLSQWITDSHGSRAGWGYSMYAEAYYNFHVFGCLFMGVFGYLYVWLENKIEKWYLNGWTVMASGWLFAAVYLIFLARADSLLFVTRLRYALYLGILCMCLRGKIHIPKLRFTIQKK